MSVSDVELLVSERKTREVRDYWAERAARAIQRGVMKLDYPRSSPSAYETNSQLISFSPGVLAKLRKLTGDSPFLLYTTVMTAIVICLRKYTDSQTIAVGSPARKIDGDSHQLTNALPIVLELDDELSFRECLLLVRQTLVDAYARQRYPFDRMLPDSAGADMENRCPLFDVAVALDGIHTKLPQVKNDLTIALSDDGMQLVATATFNRRIFTDDSIRRFMRHFDFVLLQGLEESQKRIGDLKLTSDVERHQLLVEWNHTRRDFPTDRCFHEFFEDHVRQSPDSVAVAFQDEQLTYAQLNARANQLAHHLRSLGVGPDGIVAICMDRAAEMVVALLGILKAGGAYLPLDPTYPQERLTFMLQDSRVRILLTQSTLVERFADGFLQVIPIDRLQQAIQPQQTSNPRNLAAAENLAYVIYTSGSTGVPKGVGLRHIGLSNLAQMQLEEFQESSTVRVLQFSSLSFDASTWEIVMAFGAGGTLCLAEKEALLPGPHLCQTLREQAISTLTIPPSALSNFPVADLAGLQTLIVAGEACSVELVGRWAQRRRFCNAYGPTEATVCSTVSPCHVGMPKVSIGRPIGNTTVYVLDADLEPASLGMSGEIHIGGIGLARGYLNRPGLTAEKFIPNPFSDERGARLFRSGDLACFLPDGNIDFLGRIDDQIKIRGFRIELGEIEALLRGHAQLQDAAVMLREDQPGEKRLVAYVIPQPHERPTTSALRSFLQGQLPEFMMPAAFMTLSSFPLTANGKLDRRALPAPGGARPELAASYVAPQTSIEESLSSIWSQVLGIEHVGLHDNFFELGGDSILSIQIVARSHDRGLHLTPRQLFENPTIADLAARVAPTQRTESHESAPTGPVPLSPIQHWFFQQQFSVQDHFNQAVLLEIRTPMNPRQLETILTELVSHHDALRFRFHEDASGWRQETGARKDPVPVLYIDLSAVQEARRIPALEVASAQLQESLNITDGPLLRVALFDMGFNRPQRLLIVIHHLVIDGVSWRILIADLLTAFKQMSTGRRIELPQKTTSYSRWTQHLIEHARNSSLEREVAFWTDMFGATPPRIPLDHADGQNTVGSADTISVALDVAETQALLQEVPEAYRTQINDVLLTALADAFLRWTGQRSLLVHVEGHGREEIFDDVDLARTIGWFTTLCPVVLQLPPTESRGQKLQAIKEQLRAIPNRGLGYGLLRYLSNSPPIAKVFADSPRPDIVFNYLGQIDHTLPDDAPFALAPESTGPTQCSAAERSHVLTVNGIVRDGQLQVEFTYSQSLHSRATIERLASWFIDSLRSLIAHCQLTEAGGCTPSDFPLIQLDQHALDLIAPAARDVQDIYPLSSIQQGLLFHSLYAPESGVYFEQLSFRIDGLQVEAFKQAWQEVVNRHTVLRTGFKLNVGANAPLQVVHRRAQLPWTELDWRGLSDIELRERLDSFLESDRRAGFDISTPPLMRMALMRLADESWQFVWSHHHAILDGWSGAIISQEVRLLYDGFVHQREVTLGTPRPYREYIRWLREQDVEKAKAFWKERLRGCAAPTPLGIDRPACARRGTQGDYGAKEIQLSTQLNESLRQLVRQQRVSLNTLVVGTWALLLSRYSGNRDVVFGITSSGRPASLSGIESLVGLFLSTLPMRINVAPEAPLLPWLNDLQSRQLEHREYEYSSLVDVHGWSDVPRNIPLFESSIVFENYPIDRSTIGLNRGASTNVRIWERTNYPLSVMAISEGDDLSIRVLYERSRFDDETAMRILQHFQTVLEAIVGNPQSQLSAIPLLTDAERALLVTTWNTTAREFPPACITELFQSPARVCPDAIAVVFNDEQITYRELNTRANQLARFLTKRGIGTETLVGICMHRSVEMVVGILGILKAGGAYVPLDPDNPRHRLAVMLEETQVPVLLTQHSILENLPPNVGRVICLDAEWPVIRAESQDDVRSQLTPDNLAYVIYTSGSTGKPKGTMISHLGLSNYLQWCTETYRVCDGQGTLVHSPLGFDLTVTSLLAPLVMGQRVVLVPESEGTKELSAKLRGEREFTLVKLTPSHLELLQAELMPDETSGRTLSFVIGGEALRGESLVFWRKNARGTRLINEYGPTETVVGCCTYEVLPDDDFQDAVPIGRPIANTQLYVLDSGLRLQPIGVAGELYIAGQGVARGYFHRPAWTAAKFLPAPFSALPGARMYRTGDHVRFLPDGNLEFVGRIDDQVKIRGFRVELGEIEAVLTQHPSVREAVVVVRENSPGELRLVAYVTAAAETTAPDAELRAFLKERLPVYMLPAALVPLPSFPLTASGKIDRSALPSPDLTRHHLATDYVAPRSPHEETLAAIWAEVLDVRQIGVHDDFFELGGHSLLATQVMSRVSTAFNINLPLLKLFEFATIAALAKSISQALQQPQPVADRALLPADRNTRLPLSFAQERLWFLHQLDPDSPAYNIPAAMHLTGRLHLEALERAFSEIIRRHEVLRTTFAMNQGGTTQVIQIAKPFKLSLLDLTAVPAECQAEQSRRIADEEARRPIELSSGPLLRVTLIRLAALEHMILFTPHHIVSDGWSMRLLVRELRTLYGAFLEGRPSPLPELSIQYADYSAWQRQRLESGTLDGQLAYWNEQLRDISPFLDLPTDHARPPLQSFAGSTAWIDLPDQLVQELKALSSREGATLFMTLLAAFKVLLYRYTAQTDLVVGTPIANRNREEIEGLIGFFVNTLVLRTDLSGNPSFLELLARTREVALGAYAHQDVPFEKLVDALQVERDLSRSPLFQVMFMLQNFPTEAPEIAGLTFGQIETHQGTARFDLTLECLETAQGMRATLEYNSDLFEEQTIQRMLGHFECLLQAIVGNPRRPLSELPLLTPAEQTELISTWNDTAAEYPQNVCIHDLFEAQVLVSPDAVAVAFRQYQLTYRELNARANQFARYLRSVGVGPDVLVGICIDRTVEMVVAILGILKAGGAYVPLDPTYPRQRLDYMLQNTNLGALLTTDALKMAFPSPSCPTICLDKETATISTFSRENLPRAGFPDNACYVIYTSGSTGVPKGVVISHRAVLNTLFWLQEFFSLQPQDVVAQKTASSFTDSVWELFWPLVVGSRTAIISADEVTDPQRLHQALADYGITYTQFVPPQMSAFLASLQSRAASGRTGNETPLPALKWVFNGGEALPPPTAQAWYAQLPQARIGNIYGMTESAIYGTYYVVPAGQPPKVLIGKPIGNAQAYVFDADGHVCPIGVSGELYLGGIGLTRGYWGRPDLTAEKLVPDPCYPQPGMRLYRTGDRARWLSPGELEYLGRVDHQVKIRGYRVELGEVEATLGQHPALRHVAVTLHEHRPGDKRLVAFVVLHNVSGAGSTDSNQLRQFLLDRLPPYMIPSALVVVDSLPLTPSGKVDRRRLPAPVSMRAEVESIYLAPRTPIEQELAALWSELLAVAQIGVNDNFFHLGGHSILATQVISRIRDAFHVELPLRTMFEAPTIKDLALQVQAAIRLQENRVSAPPIQRGAPNDHLPLSFAQERLWFLHQLNPESTAYNMPGTLRLTGRLHLSALEQSFCEIVRRHESLRTKFSAVSGGPCQVVAAAETVSLRLLDLRGLPADCRLDLSHELAADHTERPFDLTEGPLLRVTVLRLDDCDHLLLLTMHHVISDGWSTGVLIGELSTLYESFCRGHVSPLTDLLIQYADYALWQRKWHEAGGLQAQLTYWTDRLKDAPPLLDLPNDYARPPAQSFAGATEHFVLDGSLLNRLKALGHQEGATLFMTLLAAFQTLLHRYTGQSDILVGTPIAGRNRTEVESLIGVFVNTLVLRGDVRRDSTFRELLAQARTVASEAYAHQDLPFEKLVDELNVARDLGRTPLFQVMFVLQNTPLPAVQLSELKVRQLVTEQRTSQFDLTLTFAETENSLVGSLTYSTALFAQERIRRMTGHFRTLLEGILADPQQKIAELPLLTEPERSQLLVEWNATQAAPAELSLVELFQQQVERTPEAIAVTYEAEQLTYRELNARANQLAHYLRQRGVGPEVLVGLCLHRSPEMLVGLLGILKAGGAYLPLDPAYPQQRLDFMLADAAAPVVLTQQGLLSGLSPDGVVRICLDTDWPAISAAPRVNPRVPVDPRHAAYVIYTSGSTGTPKGTTVCHAHVARLLAATEDWFAFDAQDVWTLFHSCAFDFSVWELWGAWLYGGRLVVVSFEVSRAPELFYPLLEREGVTVLNQTPSAFGQLLAEDRRHGEVRLPLRYVIFGGEALDVGGLQSWLDRHPNTPALINMYGITETTVHVTYRALTAEDVRRGSGASVIGQRIGDLELYLLDRSGQPVPQGVGGEIHVGGAGLARGYLQRPALTAERFIPHPFAAQVPGARLYRSGDQARYRAAEDLEYLGRIDEQVKIRGFRIELGEIEAVLREHPAVSAAAVLVREEEPGDKRLVAYVVAEEETTALVSQLRTYLQRKLPDYMVPAAFVQLESFPLTPHGKIDRRALSPPDQTRPDLADDYLAPQTSDEQKLAAIWSAVLGIQQIGLQDNFFALGGDSLLATRVVSDVRSSFQLDLRIRDLFESPTIAEFVQAINRQRTSVKEPASQSILALNRDRFRRPASSSTEAMRSAKN